MSTQVVQKIVEVKSRSVLLDIFLTIITFGIWNFIVQIRQIYDVNDLIGRDEVPSFLKVLIFSILTLGIYFCYHEYSLTKKLHMLSYGERYPYFEFFFALLTFLGLWFIVDSYQQHLINRYIEEGRR